MRSTVIALNAVSGLAHIAQFGIIYPLLSLWLDAHGMPAWQIGLVGSAVWLGMMFGNLLAPQWLARLGAGALAAGGCLSTAVLALLMPLLPTQALLLWCLASSLLGIGIGLRWIGVESWLYAIVSGAQRGKVVGVHETLIYAAQCAGPALVALLGIDSISFFVGSGFAVLGSLPLLLARTPMPAPRDQTALRPGAVLLGLVQHLRRSLGNQLGLLAGVLDGVLFGMLGIYFVRRGLGADQAAFMMTIFGLGALVSQVPLGWWSDRFGVRSATRLAAVLGLAGALLLFAAHAPWDWPAAVLLGLVTSCGLTVAIIAATQSASEEKRNMGVAVAEVSIAFTLGSALGPVLAGTLLDFCGPGALPLLAALGCCALHLVTLNAHTSPLQHKRASAT